MTGAVQVGHAGTGPMKLPPASRGVPMPTEAAFFVHSMKSAANKTNGATMPKVTAAIFWKFILSLLRRLQSRRGKPFVDMGCSLGLA
jgi:hypothetical protein